MYKRDFVTCADRLCGEKDVFLIFSNDMDLNVVLEGDSDIAINSSGLSVKDSLMQCNPAFFGLANCNLSYSKDPTCIKGLRFKPFGR